MRRFLLFLFLFVGATSFAESSKERFLEVYNNALRGRVELNNPAVHDLQFVFFAGLGGEKFIPLGWIGAGYFDSFRDEAKKHGINQESLSTTHYPPSWCSVESNCDRYFKDKLTKISQSSPKKLVLIAHSKAAPELLGFALKNPDWIERHVHKLVFVSGAFQGSPLANLVTGNETRPVPLHLHLPASLVGAVAYFYMNTIYHSGTNSLRPEKIEALFERLLKEHGNAIQTVVSRSFFIQTSMEESDPSILLWFPHRYLREEAKEPTDGIVPLSYQLPRMDNLDFVHLEGFNHFVPCSSFLSGHIFSQVPRAFTTAVLSIL
jgi:hypothetical protein